MGQPDEDSGETKKAVRPLAEEFQNRLTETGGTVSSLARDLGVHRPTLWAWIKSNKFPQDQVQRIADLLYMDASYEQLQRKFVFGETLWTWANRKRPGSRSGPSPTPQTGTAGATSQVTATEERCALQMLEGLGAGSIYLHVFADSPPLEWTEVLEGGVETPVTTALVAAISRGVSVRYVCPPDEQRLSWQKDFGLAAPFNASELLNSWRQFAGVGPDSPRLQTTAQVPLYLPGCRILSVASVPEGGPTTIRALMLVRGGENPTHRREVQVIEAPPLLSATLLSLMGVQPDNR
jgi:transposase-like protein